MKGGRFFWLLVSVVLIPALAWSGGTHLVTWLGQEDWARNAEFYRSHAGKEFVYGVEAANAPIPMVCGKLNEHVIEVPQSYIQLFAEYEGASVWDPDFINNKKGCDANLVVMPLVMSWPEMKPVRSSLYFGSPAAFEGLQIDLRPLKRVGTDLKYYLNNIMLRESPGWEGRAGYMSELGLHYYVALGAYDNSLEAYYWPESGGEVPVLFKCLWSPYLGRYFTCDGDFIFSRAGAWVQIEFTPEKLKEWKLLVSASKNFISTMLKK